VGLEIATLIDTWGHKYKNIYQNMSMSAISYQQKIKKLAMQLYFKHPVNIEIHGLETDVVEGIPFAM
jgi:hypothetical protein